MEKTTVREGRGMGASARKEGSVCPPDGGPGEFQSLA